MAEFLNQQHRAGFPEVAQGMARMGQPISFAARQAAYEHCKDMGLTDHSKAMHCVNQVADSLERDEPYNAMAAGMKYLDLTGTYRLFAVLLTA